MSRMTLYQVTFRKRMMVETGFIEATSLQKAEELGRKYCSDTPNCRFVGVRDMILVREDMPDLSQQQQVQKKLA